ncbi:MAG: FHIPEP family type III secretion protein, partial [Allopontixanthobacter sediminis]
LSALTRLLRALLADGIALTHPVPLFSSIAAGLQQTQDINQLIDHIRVDLGASIVAKICGPTVPLPVITLDAQLESSILQGLRDPATGQPLVEPDLAQMIGQEVSRLMADRMVAGGNPGALALIVQPPVRRAVARLLSQRAPDCMVLSISELPASQPIEVIAVIGVEPAAPLQSAEMPGNQPKEFVPS